MKRYLVPVVAGVTVFGAVTAFAATLGVSSTTLGSGDDAVTSCNASANVSYNVAFAVGGYEVTTAPVTSAASCAAKSYKVTLTDSGGASLAEVTGSLDAAGSASPDFTSQAIKADLVEGVAVVITG